MKLYQIIILTGLLLQPLYSFGYYIQRERYWAENMPTVSELVWVDEPKQQPKEQKKKTEKQPDTKVIENVLGILGVKPKVTVDKKSSCPPHDFENWKKETLLNLPGLQKLDDELSKLTPYQKRMMDDLLYARLRQARNLGLEDNHEYGGFIYRIGDRIGSTPARKGTETGWEFKLSTEDLPEGAVILGAWHSHGASRGIFDIGTFHLSANDIAAGHGQGCNVYLMDPAGNIHQYYPVTQDIIINHPDSNDIVERTISYNPLFSNAEKLEEAKKQKEIFFKSKLCKKCHRLFPEQEN